MAYAEKRGRYWSVRYKLPGGTWSRASRDDGGQRFTSKRAALDYGNSLETDVRRKTFVNPRDGRVTVAQWVEQWRKVWEIDPASEDAYSTRLRSVILPHWGDWAIGDITTSSYLAWRKDIRARYSRNYVQAVESVMRMLLDDAVDEKLRGGNPMPSGKRRRRGRYEGDDREDDYAFPQDPVQALLVAENARVVRGPVGEAFVLTKAFTGMRLAELVGLRREFVWAEPERDPMDQWIRVEWQGAHARGGFALKPPKYGSRRTLILPPFLGDLLRQVLDSHDNEYVFPSARGKPIRTDDQFYGYFWHPIVDGHPELPQVRGRRFRPELPAVPGVAGMVPHGLRHGQRVWLEEDDIPPSAIDERMGHTVRGSGGRRREGDSQAPGTYRHVTPAMRKRIARALQRRWEKALRDRQKTPPMIISQRSPNGAENTVGTPGPQSGRTPQPAS
ncbi:hypothetical protein D7231_32110 [Streptomyces klenkii]|uniref:Site-specific integrase n=1 Tax=Streptomyces klenkii TaxID=1420899 RepID=A0A3B0ARA6_9ACTN|nr:tyrosine-type recombinase/integrase [Streptomyces klenkii]RKN61917.1 hypothetical protein D7231_32110 [Streptomyces klenkii]